MPHVTAKVEVRIVHPYGCTEVERTRPQALAEPRAQADPLGEGRHQRIPIRDRSLDDRQTADRQTHVPVGVFRLEKAGVKGCQLIHRRHLQLIRN